MAGAMPEVDACAPKRDTRQRIEIEPRVHPSESRRADLDHALQYQREEALLLLGHRTDADGPRDSVVPLMYCAPESIRKSSPALIVRSVSTVTR